MDDINCSQSPSEELRRYGDHFGIKGVLCAALAILVLVSSVAAVYCTHKEGPIDGFFEQGSRELDYYRHVYGR